MSFTIYSYNGTVIVGIACDKTLVPDHETIVDGFSAAFDWATRGHLWRHRLNPIRVRQQTAVCGRQATCLINPSSRARATASARLCTPNFLYARSARSLAAEREIPSLSAISAKVIFVGK